MTSRSRAALAWVTVGLGLLTPVAHADDDVTVWRDGEAHDSISLAELDDGYLAVLDLGEGSIPVQ